MFIIIIIITRLLRKDVGLKYINLLIILWAGQVGICFPWVPRISVYLSAFRPCMCCRGYVGSSTPLFACISW